MSFNSEIVADSISNVVSVSQRGEVGRRTAIRIQPPCRAGTKPRRDMELAQR